MATGTVHRAIRRAPWSASNVMGVQFHPEKSGAAGLQVLRNFLEMPHADQANHCLPGCAQRAGGEGGAVRGPGGCGRPGGIGRRHAAAGADEIVLLDITATHEGRGTLLDTVRRTAKELFIPFTVGGGIRTADDAAAVFDAGADKVSVNSAAIADPGVD